MSARGRELVRKVQDVAHGRCAKRVDRLRVVADDGEPASAGFQRQQDRGLQAVGVLIFVDQDVVEAPADVFREAVVRHHLRPVEQQIVVIEHVLLLLGLDIGREQLLQLVGPSGTPGKEPPDHLGEIGLGVDAARVDRQACPFGREAALGLREAEVVANQIHQVRGVLAVMDREGRIEPDLLGIVAQQPRADAVERSGPAQRVGHHRRHCRPAPCARCARRAWPSRRLRGARKSSAGCAADRPG